MSRISLADRVRRPKMDFGRWLLLCPALCLLLYGIYIGWGQIRVINWPEAQAFVIEYDPGDVHPDWSGSWYANPKIEYKYSVDGKEFISNQISLSPMNYQTKESFQEDLGHVKKGEGLKCWYNPNAPWQSYIINKGVSFGPIFIVILGSTLLLVAIFAKSKEWTTAPAGNE